MSNKGVKAPTAGVIAAAWHLLTPRQKRGAVLVAALFSAASGLELLALSSLAFFVSILISPDLMAKSRVASLLSHLLNLQSLGNFAIYVGVISAGLLIAATGASFGVQFLMDWLGVRIARSLCNALLTEALHAPYVWHTRQSAAGFSKNLYADPSAIGVGFFPPFMEFGYNTFIVMFSVAIIVASSPWQSLVAIVGIGCVALSLTAFVRPRAKAHSAIERTGAITCNKMGVECIAGAKDILIKSRQGYFLRLYDDAFVSSFMSRMRGLALQRVTPMSFLSIGQISLIVIAIVLFTSNRSSGEIAQNMALLVVVVSRFLPAVSRGLAAVTRLHIASPYLESYMRQMADLAEERRHRSAVGGGAEVPAHWRELRLSNVSFTYPGSEVVAVRGVSLMIERGRSYGVVGRSGSGKTTVIDIILGLHAPQTGRVELDGKPLSAFSVKSWYRKIGYVPQMPFISDESLRRNVAFGVPASMVDDAKVRRVLETAGFGDVLSGLEDGLDTRLGDHGLRLSGGQRQRVAIARALYDDPDIIVLDEATSALDSVTENQIQDAIEKLAQEKTTITIAHRFSTVRNADTLFVFDGGRLVAQGSFDDLYRADPLFRQLAGASDTRGTKSEEQNDSIRSQAHP